MSSGEADDAARDAAAEPRTAAAPAPRAAAAAADAAAEPGVALAALELADEASPGADGDEAAAAAKAVAKAEAAARRDAAVVQQTEFYFSDENLPTDEFLLGKIRSNKHGWVSLHTIVRFNKMKRLCKGDAGVAAAALRAGSTALEVDPSGGSVRRVAPLPDSDPLEIGSRTVVAENLPGDGSPTVASLEALFAKAGRVRMLRVCPPTSAAGSGGRSTLQAAAEEAPWASLNVVSAQTHALVEYETRAEALAAVAQLNDNANWRTGLRVRLVRREAPAFTRAAKGDKGVDKTNAPSEGVPAEGVPAEGVEAADGGAEGGDAAAGASADAPGAESGAGRGRKGKKDKAPKRDYAAWASVGAHRETMQRERAAAAAAAEAGGGDAGAAAVPQPAAAEAGAGDGAVRPVRRFAPPSGGAAGTAPGSGPAVREAAMPDGTRGFTRGRGRPLNPLGAA